MDNLKDRIQMVWRRYGYWFVLCGMTILWFSTLHYRYLISPDEGRYAEIAREMLMTGDWITPHLNGIKYFEKPILQYWISAFFFYLFGFSEFAARLWPALSGFMAACFTGFVAYRLWGKAAGQLAVWILLSMAWWVGNAHFLTLDMGVSSFLAVGLGSFLLAQHHHATKKENGYFMLLAWLAIALACLSKGLIGIVIPGASIVLYSLWQRDWRLWAKLHMGKGITLFLLIAAPWFILVSIANPNFPYFFFIGEHFARYATDGHHRVGAFYYFFGFLIVGLIPWISFLLSALQRVPYKKTTTFSPEKFLLIWALFILVFFSFSSSKLPSYILPAFPALALLMAPAIQAISVNKLRIHTWILCGIASSFFGGAWVFYYALSGNMERIMANQGFAQGLLLGGITSLFFGVLALWQVKRQNKTGVLLCFSLVGLIGLQIAMLGHRAYGPIHTSYFLAEAIKPYIQKKTPIYIVGFYNQTLPFYLQRTIRLVNYKDEFTMGLNLEPQKKYSEANFIHHWRHTEDAIAILSEKKYQQFVARGLGMKVIAKISDQVAVMPNRVSPR